MTPLARDLFSVIDLACSSVVVLATTAVGFAYVLRRSHTDEVAPPSARWHAGLTRVSLFAGATAGLLLACGRFGMAGLALALTPLAKLLDGHARRAPLGPRVLATSVEQYEELFALSGLAFYFRSSAALLALTLLAAMGSFMVAYGSAKAEARDVRVPPSTMQRFERAICLAAGVTLAPFAGVFASRVSGPEWVFEVPAVVAVAFLGVAANVSAVRRLRSIARAPTLPVERAPQASESQVARASAH